MPYKCNWSLVGLSCCIVFLSVFLAATNLAFALPWNDQVQNNSYQNTIGNKTFIFVQSFLRSSDGHLISYIKSDQFTYVDEKRLAEFLDSQVIPSDPVLDIKGHTYQAVVRQHTTTYDHDDVIASNQLTYSPSGEASILAVFIHDGFAVKKGDSQTTVWTFIRPQ